MFAPEVRALMGKELRQLMRSRSAIATALLLPLLMLVVVPVLQMLAMGAQPQSAPPPLPAGVPLPPGLRAGAASRAALMQMLLPLFVLLGGMVAPAATMVHALITEREGRTLELLVALPVRVGQILLAKVAALLAVVVPVTFVLYSITASVMLWKQVGGLGLALALWGLLVAALAFSACAALLVSLLARDFRTANNLAGALIVPSVFIAMAAIFLAPGPLAATAVLAGMLAVGGATCLWVALKVVTFERLLR